MTGKTRRLLQGIAVGTLGCAAQFFGPCESLQYPPDNTEAVWGVALAQPKNAVWHDQAMVVEADALPGSERETQPAR